MKNGVMLVWSNPISPDQEAEYNKWYNEVHIPELTANGHCTKVSRYKVADDDAPSHRYLAIYEFDDHQAWLAGRAGATSTPGPLDPATKRALFEDVFEFVVKP